MIIRATGTDAYNPYIYYSDATNNTGSTPADGWVGGAAQGLSSVETLVIPARQQPTTRSSTRWSARPRCLHRWRGSGRLHQELEGHRTRSHPAGLDGPSSAVGGTSAGLAVLGQFDFAALQGSVTTSQALGDPFNKYMTLDPAP